MLLRISLIVAILAGIGAVVLTQIKVKPHIEGIIAEREKNAKDRDSEKLAKNKAQTQLKETQAKLGDTEKKLTDTEQQRAAAESKASAAETAANALKTQLAATQAAKTESDTKLSEWAVLGVTPQQVKGLSEEVGKLREANKSFTAENKVLLSKVKVLDAQLKALTEGAHFCGRL